MSQQVALEEVLRLMNALPPAARQELEEEALEQTRGKLWIPNPGPQTAAFYCEADELFYGGEAGGGKTDLAVGLALEAHERSLILREFKDDARELGDRLVQILGSNVGWNGQFCIYRRGPQRIRFDGLPNEKDKQRHKGKPNDLIVFEEVGDFYETQFDFIVGWNRSTTPGQRCRVLCTGNPPTRAKGLWVIRRWGPWLDPKHPRPAKDGELRWFLRDEKTGEEREVDGPGPYQIAGELVRAKSRTFIRAKLKDNPDLASTNYSAQLAGLPKELRDAYMLGKFDASLKDHPFQVFPTTWVMAAQARWTKHPPIGVPQCGLGVDPAGGAGGGDRFTIVPRYDWWFGEPTCITELKKPSDGAGHVVTLRHNNADICIDMGGGYGGPTWERLMDNGITPIAYKGAAKATGRTKDGKLAFVNKRSQFYWQFREALDPDQEGGSPIALPPDPELLADLTVLTWETSAHGIAVLPKEKVVELLGRSPDKGDATMLAHHAGPRGIAPALGAEQYGPEQRIAAPGKRNSLPKVDLGPRHRHYGSRR
jgi:hypothetical protein